MVVGDNRARPVWRRGKEQYRTEHITQGLLSNLAILLNIVTVNFTPDFEGKEEEKNNIMLI